MFSLHLFIHTISRSLSPPPLADLNNIKFSAYRTAMKLRRVQKALRCTYRLLFMVKSEGGVKSCTLSHLCFNKSSCPMERSDDWLWHFYLLNSQRSCRAPHYWQTPFKFLPLLRINYRLENAEIKSIDECRQSYSATLISSAFSSGRER